MNGLKPQQPGLKNKEQISLIQRNLHCGGRRKKTSEQSFETSTNRDEASQSQNSQKTVSYGLCISSSVIASL